MNVYHTCAGAHRGQGRVSGAGVTQADVRHLPQVLGTDLKFSMGAVYGLISP